MSENNFLHDKIIVTFIIILSSLLMIICAVTIYLNPLPEGYETTIYEIYPAHLWFLLFIIFLISSLCLIHYYNKVKLAKFSIINIINLTLLLIYLPNIRGYYLYACSDNIAHIGHIFRYLEKGNIFNTVYPLFYSLIISIIEIANMEVYTISFIFVSLFSFIYVLFIYILINKLFYSRMLNGLAIVIAFIPVFGSYNFSFTPFFTSFYIFPLMIYFLIIINSSDNQNKLGFIFCYIVMLIFSIFYHPLFLIFFLPAIILFNYININKYKSTFYSGALLSIILSLYWGTESKIIIDSIKRISRSEASSAVAVISQTQSDVTLFEIFKVFTFTYGSYFLLIMATFIILLYSYKYYIINKQYNFLYFYLLFITYIALLSLFFLLPMLGSPVEPRLFPFVAIISTIIILIFIPRIVEKKWFKPVGILFIASMVFLSLFTFYPSDLNNTYTYQVTPDQHHSILFLTNSCNQAHIYTLSYDYKLGRMSNIDNTSFSHPKYYEYGVLENGIFVITRPNYQNIFENGLNTGEFLITDQKSEYHNRKNYYYTDYHMMNIIIDNDKCYSTNGLSIYQ